MRRSAACLICTLAIGSSAHSAAPASREAPVVAVANLQSFIQEEGAYAGQQKTLQAELGPNVFVATFRGVIHDGRIVSFASWTNTVPTALPKTDFVWLQNATFTRWFVVPWSDLETAIGTIPKMDHAGPARYLTPQNIPTAYFSSLEKRFVPPTNFPSELASGRR